MINRILIRIKVVQILYSYLLNRSEFKVDAAPESASRDRKFAYAVYLDLMLLLCRLSGVKLPRGGVVIDSDKRLRLNRVGAALYDNDTLKELLLRRDGRQDMAFDGILQDLHDKIVSTAVFADYKKKRSHTLADDVNLWVTLLRTVVSRDEALIGTLRAAYGDEFTLSGFNRGVEQLINTLVQFNDSRAAYANAKRELQQSLDEAYNLYFAMFVLIIELTRRQEERLENAKNKYLATAEDLNPNTRLVDNLFVKRLRDNADMVEHMKSHKDLTWINDEVLLKKLLDSILSSQAYEEYLSAPAGDYEADCEFWRKVMRGIILPSDTLAESMENMSIYWNDDLDIMGTFVLKTIRHFAVAGPEGSVSMMPRYKDDEDAAFGLQLFTKAVENRELYRSYIDRFINSSQWDPERLAFMDIVIMIAAIAELVNYPAIPVPVTMNEYVEIANSYSTAKSGPFINGILFAVLSMLRDEGIVNKQ